ncbi:DNA-directed RNA polymerase III subunit RPC3-like isoform X1 [Branchiostoma floridae]|uniref:DNA-directed RNA polymerase III subunit RPC3 n=1 Tax=Branchiostoma floridae TaxID=7739 RepID=A0A9J7HRM2_BRAFL|nr:DNA-directed RNA polymerase III subunit RPC3-like isoform X1 [Branchiostoma floridae]
MAQSQVRLGGLLLQHQYGEIVENVGTFLASKGSFALRDITDGTKLGVNEVKKALCVLIQHNMMDFEKNRRGLIEYTVHINKVLLITRYPRYIYCAKTLYGDVGEFLVEELLSHGQMLMSQVCRRVSDRITQALEEGQSMDEFQVRKTFVELVKTHFLQRVASPPSDSGDNADSETELQVMEKEMFLIPPAMDIDYSKVHSSVTSSSKRKREDGEEGDKVAKRPRSTSPLSDEKNEDAPDKGVYWHVNFTRFHQFFRDQSVLSAVNSKIDRYACEIVRTMLRISEKTTVPLAPTTHPMSSHEIFQNLPPELDLNRQTLGEYLTLLAEDKTEIVNKAGESGGGMYVLNMQKALETLCKASIESVVQERFGSKCSRIFRLLLMKRHLEQKQVEDMAMIPAKEAKELLYKLFSENFVTMQEIPKTPDHAPSRTFYLFGINMHQVSRMLLDRCYKAMGNLISRREHENTENRRLVEKSQRVDAIAASLQSSGADTTQMSEVEEMITPPERQQLNKLKHDISKLEQSELQLDETIFLLESYLPGSAAMVMY